MLKICWSLRLPSFRTRINDKNPWGGNPDKMNHKSTHTKEGTTPYAKGSVPFHNPLVDDGNHELEADPVGENGTDGWGAAQSRWMFKWSSIIFKESEVSLHWRWCVLKRPSDREWRASEERQSLEGSCSVDSVGVPILGGALILRGAPNLRWASILRARNSRFPAIADPENVQMSLSVDPA